MIAPLTAEQIEAARSLTQIFVGTRVALVGAAALGCWLPLRSKTEDVDFVVATSVESAQRLQVCAGWTRHRTKEHEWTAPNGVTVDIIPAPADALANRRLVWPESGHVMNLTGLRLVFEKSEVTTIGEDLEVLLPSVPVISLLKMIAYLDRHDRTAKDLGHLAHIFDEFPPDDDERMFTVEQAAAGLSPDEARIQVLSRELAAIIDDGERADCARFVASMRNDPAHAARFVREMIQPKDDREPLLARRLELLALALRLDGGIG